MIGRGTVCPWSPITTKNGLASPPRLLTTPHLATASDQHLKNYFVTETIVSGDQGTAMLDGDTDATIQTILTTTSRIALVGASAKPWRASHEVMRFLLDRGYDVIPVNPVLAGQTIHGRTVVASLADAAPLQMVDVFRASIYVAALVDRAIQLGAKTIWMQLGVIDHAAAAKARAAGIAVVMDRCPVIEDRRIGPFRAPAPAIEPNPD